MQILFYVDIKTNLFLCKNCLATIGVCVFCAFTSVDALFFIWRRKMKKKNLSKLITAIVVLLLSFSLVLCACANNDNTTPNTPDDNQIVQPDDQDKNQPSTPTPEPP